MDRKGQGLVEYALIIVFLSIALVAALALFGNNLVNAFVSIGSKVAGAGS